MKPTTAQPTALPTTDPSAAAVTRQPHEPWLLTALIAVTIELDPDEASTPEGAIDYAAAVIRDLPLFVAIGGVVLPARWTSAPVLVTQDPSDQSDPSDPSSLLSSVSESSV